jgi:hypothetical protein
MKPAPRSGLRSVLIPLNLIVVTAMLISLLLGTPPVTPLAAALVIAAALSAVEILSRLAPWRHWWRLVVASLVASVRWLPPVPFGKVGIAAVTIAIVAILVGAMSLLFMGDDERSVCSGCGGGVGIIVASRDIPAGTKLSPEMIEVTSTSRVEYMFAGGMSLSPNFWQVCRMASVPIAKGELFSSSKHEPCESDSPSAPTAVPRDQPKYEQWH